MKRVDVKVTGANDPVRAAADLMISAYKDEISKRIVIVVINPKAEKRHLQLSVQDGFAISGHQLCAYTTDADHNLKKSLVPADNLSVPPLSVVTLTANYE
jgi:hypothetical protein